jgi:predicted AlkP superfamily phosphohydrolase/phosphomutase
VAALCFPGLDRVAHVFLRYARPADFGNVSGRDVDLYGQVLERYYRRIDAIVGSVLQSETEAALVLVTATHGIEPAPALHRLRDELLGGEHLSGVHADAPPGFLFAHGTVMARGRVIGKGSIADVTPTVLYALGLPVARDAHGSILAAAFTEAFTAAHPVTVIGSYDAQP